MNAAVRVSMNEKQPTCHVRGTCVALVLSMPGVREFLLIAGPGSQPRSPEWVSWTNVALGLWLAISAFVLSHSTGDAVTENVIAGLVAALSAVWAARAFRPRVALIASWTVALTGLWVLVAPFVLGYERESVSVMNDVIVGAAIFVLGVTNVMFRSRRITS